MSSDEMDCELLEESEVAREIFKQEFKRETVYPVVSGASTLPTAAGLRIKGYGTVGLPVNEIVVDSLRRYFAQAPFGKGFETVIDTEVRNCWQLGKENFELTHPAWELSLQYLTLEAAQKLGVTEPVKSVPYKLLMYEKGSFFLPHQDTEKEEGMFATLIIQLPSIFEGGELIMYVGKGKPHVCNLGAECNDAERTVYYTMHYADIRHEIKPLTAGVRLAIAYNVCFNKEGSIVPKTSSEMFEDPLKNVIATLFKDTQVILPLSHEYTKKSLKCNGLKILKGKDRRFVQRLKNLQEIVPKDKGIEIILLTFNKRVVEQIYEFEPPTAYPATQRTTAYDLEGTILSCTFDCIPEAKFAVKGVKESGYAGNEGATRVTEYLKTFVVVIAAVETDLASRLAFFGPTKILTELKSSLQDPSSSQIAQVQRAKEILSLVKIWSLEDCHLFVEIAVLLNSEELASKFLQISCPYLIRALNTNFMEVLCVTDNKKKVEIITSMLTTGIVARNRKMSDSCNTLNNAEIAAASLLAITPLEFLEKYAMQGNKKKADVEKYNFHLKLVQEVAKYWENALIASKPDDLKSRFNMINEHRSEESDEELEDEEEEDEEEAEKHPGITSIITNTVKIMRRLALDFRSFLDAVFFNVPYSEISAVIEDLKANGCEALNDIALMALKHMHLIFEDYIVHVSQEGRRNYEYLHVGSIIELALDFGAPSFWERFSTTLANCNSLLIYDRIVEWLRWSNLPADNSYFREVIKMMVSFYKQQLEETRKMPNALVPNHPGLEAFLRSGERDYTIDFPSVTEAQAFKISISGINNKDISLRVVGTKVIFCKLVNVEAFTRALQTLTSRL